MGINPRGLGTNTMIGTKEHTKTADNSAGASIMNKYDKITWTNEFIVSMYGVRKNGANVRISKTFDNLNDARAFMAKTRGDNCYFVGQVDQKRVLGDGTTDYCTCAYTSNGLNSIPDNLVIPGVIE